MYNNNASSQKFKGKYAVYIKDCLRLNVVSLISFRGLPFGKSEELKLNSHICDTLPFGGKNLESTTSKGDKEKKGSWLLGVEFLKIQTYSIFTHT